MDLLVKLQTNISSGLLWSAVSGRQLGRLEPCAMLSLQLSMTAVRSGLLVCLHFSLIHVNSALHPSGVTKSSTSFGWGKSNQSKVKYMWICIVRPCERLCAQIWITQCYLQTIPYLPLLPVAERHRRLAGTHCAYPRRDGQAELTWVVG